MDASGRRLKRSTKTTDRKTATKLAEQFEDAARKKRTIGQARKVLQELHRSITGENLASLTVRQHVENWLHEKHDAVTASTYAFYRGNSDKFLAFMGGSADVDIADVNRQHILRFRGHEARKLSPKTVNHELTCLRMIFKAARRDGLISEDPCEHVESVKQSVSSVERRPFTLDEIKAVLEVADGEWRSMVLFGLYTGQRLADIATLTWRNVDLLKGEISLVTRKTGRRLRVPIAGPLMRHLEEIPSGDNPDMPLHQRAFDLVQKHGKAGHLSRHFAEILALAGLRKRKPHGSTGLGRSARRESEGLSFHCLRHTAVTLLKEAGIPAAVVMELIGHDSEAMSDLYTHVGREALEKAAASLPSLVE